MTRVSRPTVSGLSRRALLQAGAAAALLPALGAGPLRAQTAQRIGFTPFSYAATLSVQIAEAFNAAAKQLGIEGESFDGQSDPSIQVNGLNQQIGRGFGGIALEAVDGGSIRGLARVAEENKVWLSHVWGNAPWFTPWDASEYYSLHIQPNEFEGLGQVTRVLIEALGGEGTIVRVGGLLNDSSDVVRSAGADKVIAEYPGITFAGELPGDWTPEQSQKAAAALLSRFPDTRGIIAQNDDTATGVIAAIRAIGKVPGKDILVVGTNGTLDGARRIKDGTQLASAANNPSFIGYTLAANLYDRLNGWTPEPLERALTFRAEILTKDNIDAYIERYIDAPVETHFDATKISRVKSPEDWDPQYELIPSDIDEQWINQPKPEGYSYPEAYVKGREDGSYERIVQQFKDHYKIKLLDKSPLAG